MAKLGTWEVNFSIVLDGDEIEFDDLEENSREHILELIRAGYTNGEIVEESDE